MADVSEHRWQSRDLDALLDKVAKGFAFPMRSPLLRTPADQGLNFENRYFPSLDGVPLEAWFMPREGSDKLILAAHPLMFNRYGFPGHLEPWKSAFGEGLGNDVEVNFIPDYKILHENGYNVLAFDFRNFGVSGSANGGIQSNGKYEYRDILGALAYIRSRPDLAKMTLGLFCRCLGANSTCHAIEQDPAAFADVRCLVGPLLISPRVILGRQMEHMGLGEHVDVVDAKQRLHTSMWASEMSPLHAARSVNLPVLTYGVHDDSLTHPSDLESIFAAMATKDKKMFWIEGTTRRWDGYLYFQRHPEQILDWFARHMG